MLRSDLCDYSDAYIVVKGDITLTKAAKKYFIDVRNRLQHLKTMNALFANCISKTNNVLLETTGDIDVAIPMYNLIKQSKNYRKATASSWSHYKDEPNNPPLNSPVGNNPPIVNYNSEPITNPECFKYKTNIAGKTSNANPKNEVTTEQGQIKSKKILKLFFH